MPEMVVASYNLHVGVDGWGRRFDLSQALRTLDADVIVLNEAWWPDSKAGAVTEAACGLGYLVHDLVLAHGHLFGPPPTTGRGWGPPARNMDQRALRLESQKGVRGQDLRWPSDRIIEQGSWGTAVLSRLPVLGATKIDLGKLRRDPARRGALVIELDVAGCPVSLIATHLSHLTHGSLRQLFRLRESLPDSGAPAVLAGDMNLWGPPVTALLRGWRRAVSGRTWPAWRPLAQIDHILLNPAVRLVTGEVLDVGGSDHRPIRARVSVA